MENKFGKFIQITERTTSIVILPTGGAGGAAIEHKVRQLNIMEDQSSPANKLVRHLIQAVNNRTRERNYFRLCTQLLKNEISDEEFDREIDEHEDDYVITTDTSMSAEDINLLCAVAPNIKGVDTLEDLQDLFSIDPTSTIKALPQRHG